MTVSRYQKKVRNNVTVYQTKCNFAHHSIYVHSVYTYSELDIHKDVYVCMYNVYVYRHILPEYSYKYLGH